VLMASSVAGTAQERDRTPVDREIADVVQAAGHGVVGLHVDDRARFRRARPPAARGVLRTG